MWVLIVVSSLVMQASVLAACGLIVAVQRPENTDSVAEAHGLNCSVASGIFLDQGSNP